MNSTKRNIRILVVAGVRPQYIKLAALKKIVDNFNKNSNVKIEILSLNAGQHYSDNLAGELIRELKLDFDFSLEHPHKDHMEIFCGMVLGTYNILKNNVNKIDWVLVFGDSNPAMAGAIAAAKNDFPIIHIDAGSSLGTVRTQEVLNGKVVDQLANVYFSRSKSAVSQLTRAGITNNVFWTGDVLRDFITEYAKLLPDSYEGYAPGSYILATMHRQENLVSDELVRNCLMALNSFGKKVLFLTHPRTRQKAEELGLLNLNNIEYLPPINYGQTISAMKGSAFIVTDSGGIPGEAYYLGKRCLLRSDMDYWPGLTAAGIHKLVGATKENVDDGLRWIAEALKNNSYPTAEDLDNPDGYNKAFEYICEITI